MIRAKKDWAMDDTLTSTSMRSSRRRDDVEHAGRAGLLAALVMLAVQLIWRLNWSKDGVVQAFPEFIVAAISRLTPLAVFGAATENYGSLAKKTLLAAVLVGIVAIGFRSGMVAGWLSRRMGLGAAGRVIAGLIVAAVLLLFTLVVVMPIAHLGLFARDSSYTSDILTQLVTTFALFGVLWAVFAAPRLSESEVDLREGELVSRRNLLGQAAWGVGTIAAAIAVAGATWRLVSPRKQRVNAAAQQSTQDILATAEADAASREATAQAQAAMQEADAETLFAQLDTDGKISPVLTEVDDFYHVSKNLSDPTVDSGGWSLKITGMVNTPLELSYDEVVARSTEQKFTTLSCISNELNGDLTGTALWTGFPLKTLLDEAGVQQGAVDLKLKAADDYEDSFPLDRGLDPDTFVVTGMNGAPLRDDHGFPARMIVPGIYGMKNVKWLKEVEVVGEDFQGYWQTRGWSDTAVNQIWGRIDEPNGNDNEPGPMVASGLASAGDRGINRVEVSLDDGATWADAMLEPALNPPFTWVRWAYQFIAEPDTSYKLKMRATDGTGQVMLEESNPPLPDGATGWPRRQFKTKG